MRRHHLIQLLVCLLTVSNLIAQDLNESNFTRYTTIDGLSDNNVTGIEQDAVGYVWLATAAGLNRYDGSRFIQYHSGSDSLSPASEGFARIQRLDRERLAFLPVGLHLINTQTNERRNLFIPYSDKQYQYKFNMVERARGDAAGNIYALTRGGFYHYDKNDRLVFRFDYFAGKDVATEHFFFGNDLLELDEKRLLIVARPGLYVYHKDQRKFSKLNTGEVPLLDQYLLHYNAFRFFQIKPGKMLLFGVNTDSMIYLDIAANKKAVSHAPFQFSNDIVHWRSKLIPAGDNLFYLTGHVSGFYSLRLDDLSGVVKLLPEKHFGAYLCNDLITDRDHHLWVATNSGLFRQDDARRHVEVAPVPAEVKAKFPNLALTAVYATADKIYAGAKAGGGLLVFDKKTLRFERNWLAGSNAKDNTVFEIISPSPATFVTASLGRLALYNYYDGTVKHMNPPGWKEEDWVSDVFKDSRGDIWISSANIYRYHPPTKTFSIIPFNEYMPSLPVAIQEDRDGNIWMAGHGIRRYNISLGRFDERIDSFPYIKMPDKQVSAMYIDRNNNIWFGSSNNGLIVYNMDNQTFRHFTTANGLPGNDVSALIAIGNKLWVACYAGLACVDLASFGVNKFGRDEGFPELPLQNRAGFFYDSADGRLYLGFTEAVARFNPAEVLAPGKIPTLFIEKTEVIGDRNIFLPSGTIRSSWKRNNLAITIGSINFNDGQSQGYAFRILNKDDSTWRALGNQPSFNISNLEPGNHRIQVKIFSLNNRWPEQVKEINIEILPPFWQKTWFAVVAAMLLSAILFFYVQWRINAAKKKEMVKTQIEKLKAIDYKNKYELEQITYYFSSALADKRTADEVLWDVAKNLIARLNYEDCMIYLWNDDKTRMIQKAAYGLKGRPELLTEQLFDVKPGQGVVGYVMQTKEAVLIKDTRMDPRYRVDEAQRLSEICVPIIHNNELLGIIDSEHSGLNYYSERDLKILTTIATLIGNKLKQLESQQILAVKTEELSNINLQLAEAKLTALQAQMNPHFVFNALNSIKRMILDGDNDKASRYLSKFAQMIRMTLNHSRETFVTLAENLDYIKVYLGMEQLRFNESFKWTIHVAEDIDVEDTKIPSLMIQPLVENAIWHGLLHSDREKVLAVSFFKKDEAIVCVIEDNGIGIRNSEKMKEESRTNHRPVGLDNLRNRVKILNEKYDVDCSFVIADLSELDSDGVGTRATLQFKSITI
jgi:ligand-binding sensor domain-containing protein/putative methionine-R-sulfoxide reductase with GAF domain